MIPVKLHGNVSSRKSTLFLIFLIVLALGRGALPAGRVAANSPVDLSGTWALDIYLSDRPEQVARALQVDTGELTPETFGRGAESPGASGIGRYGTARGRSGGPGRQRAPVKDQLGSEDRKKLTELTGAIRFPPLTLTISQSETEIAIATGAGAPQTLHTDGKAGKIQLDAGAINRTATWEGPQLVVAYEVGHGTLKYTYSLVPTTKQLLIRVNFERPGEPGPFEIRLVYGRAAASNTAG